MEYQLHKLYNSRKQIIQLQQSWSDKHQQQQQQQGTKTNTKTSTTTKKQN
jgi:hypothetical protein